MVPIERVRTQLDLSPATLRRRMTGIERHRFRGGYAVKWGDIRHLFEKKSG